MTKVIEMEGVCKIYGKNENAVHALQDIKVSVDEGDFVYVIGPSGAGKSTFIKLIYREEKLSKGKLIVNGRDLNTIRNSQVPIFRRDIGCVFQDFKLLDKMTVYENIAFVLDVINTPKAKIKERVMDVLETMKLIEKADSYPHELSGGQQQRVAIARAIVNNPKILICDEPTGNLDPTTGDEIFKALQDINASGTTIIMTTHNRELVNQYKKRVVVIENGNIVSDNENGEYIVSEQNT